MDGGDHDDYHTVAEPPLPCPLITMYLVDQVVPRDRVQA